MPEKKRRWYIPVVAAPVVAALVSGCTFTGTVTAGGASPVSESEPLTSSSTPPEASTKKSGASQEPTPEKQAEKKPEKVEPKPEKSTGPEIVYFRVKQKPTCESGTDAVRYPGQPVILEWKATGAEKTTLSVDGPGIYAEYGAKDSATLDFPCAGTPNSYVSHRYLLTVTSGHTTRTKLIHVKARVNEIAAL
ncbi:hypothetical protein Ait01nite_043110 [Actinoplanes italicus]|uniref:Ig-like domain-containing protein n=1 Tax=Actinoplanes italicus TaxID=113567 RepID=A0A2T0KC40_9ACTN|nr:hypothetical protein [Actinoplanes italicus]PRX20791.1 hypothetical protein CLV67_10768 [Actinoplanes italicus]GIE31266.1 hypothetical protein Ait01nite_043110 [Actinoplanes italicus]